MYILMEDIKNYGSLLGSLEKLGLKNSMFSTKSSPIKAVAIYNPLDDVAVYILLDERMTSTDPKMSWINSRKRVMTQEDLIERVKSLVGG